MSTKQTYPRIEDTLPNSKTEEIWSESPYEHLAKYHIIGGFALFIGMAMFFIYTSSDLHFLWLVNETWNPIVTYFFMFLVILFFEFLLFNGLNNSATSIKYSIHPNHISLEWGYLLPRKIDVPFSEIVSFLLIEHNETEKSDIVFSTKKEYPFHKIPTKGQHPLLHLTFQNISNGKKVYETINTIHSKAST